MIVTRLRAPDRRRHGTPAIRAWWRSPSPRLACPRSAPVDQVRALHASRSNRLTGSASLPSVDGPRAIVKFRRFRSLKRARILSPRSANGSSSASTSFVHALEPPIYAPSWVPSLTHILPFVARQARPICGHSRHLSRCPASAIHSRRTSQRPPCRPELLLNLSGRWMPPHRYLP